MRKILVAFYLLSALLSIVSAENLVKNSGFENYVNGILKIWEIRGDKANFVISNDCTEGKNSVKLLDSLKKNFCLRQDVHLENELQYKLSAKIKGTNIKGYKKGFITVINCKWNWEAPRRLVPTKPDTGWKEYSQVFTPKGKKHKIVIFKFHSFKGNLYFDDIKLSKVLTSAELQIDNFANTFTKGKGVIEAKLLNRKKENADFVIEMSVKNSRGKVVLTDSKKVKLNSADNYSALKFKYSIDKVGQYFFRWKVLKDGKAVDIVTKTITFKDLIALKYVNPPIRKYLKFANSRNVDFDVIFNKPLSSSCVLTASICNSKNRTVLVSQEKSLISSKNTSFSLPISKLSYGQYSIKVQLVAQKKTITEITSPFDLLNPAQSTGFDKQGNLLINGDKFLPVGFLGGMISAKELANIKKHGFNTILFYRPYAISSLRPYLDKIHENKLKAVIYMGGHRDSESKLQKLTDSVKDHPALLAYDTADEPGGRYPLSEYENAYKWLSDRDPKHPVTIIFDSLKPAFTYTAGVDFSMLDPYPNKIPKLSNKMVYDDIYDVRSNSPKPVWGVPPTFGQERVAGNPKVSFVYPEPDEMRNIYYLTVAAGAKGFMGYCYNSKRKYKKNNTDWNDPNRIFLPEENPEIWQVCVKMAKELKILKPFIFAPYSPEKVIIKSVDKNIHYLYKEWDDTYAVLVVNSSKLEKNITLTIPEKFSGNLVSPISGEKVKCVNGTFSQALAPLGDIYMEFKKENSVSNHGFENNLKDYVVVPRSADGLLLTSDEAAEGFNSLTLGNSYSGKACIKQQLKLRKGAKYKLSVRMKGRNVADGKCFGVKVANKNGKWKTESLSPVNGSSEWKKYSTVFTAPASNIYELVICKTENFDGKIYLDDIKLTREGI